jgi:hypothetical protein
LAIDSSNFSAKTTKRHDSVLDQIAKDFVEAEWKSVKSYSLGVNMHREVTVPAIGGRRARGVHVAR